MDDILKYMWDPELPLTSNGEPLATRVSDLFTDFPYKRNVGPAE